MTTFEHRFYTKDSKEDVTGVTCALFLWMGVGVKCEVVEMLP